MMMPKTQKASHSTTRTTTSSSWGLFARQSEKISIREFRAPREHQAMTLRQRGTSAATGADTVESRGHEGGAKQRTGEAERADFIPQLGQPDHSILFPMLALTGLAALSVRGFWKLLNSPGASVGDDLSSHYSEISTFTAALRSGSFDLWFDRTQMGYPLLMTCMLAATKSA